MITASLFGGRDRTRLTSRLGKKGHFLDVRALPMGLQGVLTRDLLYSIRKAGRDELLMNAAGQSSGLLREIRPAKDILDEIVGDAADLISRRLPSMVQAAVA